MSHNLHAIIGPTDLMEAAAFFQKQLTLIQLPQAMSLLPVTYELVDANDPFIHPFLRMTSGLHEYLVGLSEAAPIAYIETDYFGGVGSQAAIGFGGGKVISGPFSDENGEQISPINTVLEAIGVQSEEGMDRFDTLELGRFRCTEDI